MSSLSSTTEADGDGALARVVREESPRVLASLVRVLGRFDLAEDALQDAAVAALETWPRRGVPANLRAWLTVTARNRALDRLRREATRDGREAAAVRMVEGWTGEPPPESQVRDDLLRLVFTCCHPSLAPDTQVALALRTLCGLTTAEVARALVVSEATMAKRLTRARQKIRVAGIPYRIPPDHELPSRLDAVAATVYLLFNEGYAATAGPSLVRVDLAEEALRLARLLCDLQPGEPALIGLLALLLLQHARRAARIDVSTGEPVLLRDQDRSRWDQAAIVEGVTLVGEGLRRTPSRPDRYVVQAAIAACHALAPSADDTDWVVIVSWYDVLLTVHDTPVVRLNRAVAVAERDGADAGLALVEELEGLEEYALWHGARAELLERAGRRIDAVVAYERAIALPLADGTRRALARRRDTLVAGG